MNDGEDFLSTVELPDMVEIKRVRIDPCFHSIDEYVNHV